MGWSHGESFCRSSTPTSLLVMKCWLWNWWHDMWELVAPPCGWVFGASKCRSTTRGDVLIGSWIPKVNHRWERVTWYGGIKLVLNGSSLPWLLPLRQGRITSHHIWSLQDPNQNHNEIIMNHIQVTELQGQLNEHLYRHQHLHITPTCL